MPIRSLLLPACLIVGALASVALGQDISWDLRNYHIANVHALLAGRLGIDLQPAGMQSYLNPALDIPYVVLGRGLLAEHPRLLAGLMGLFYGALLYLALRLAWALLPLAERPDRLLIAGAAGLAAATGAATRSEIGTTYNDLQTALPILGALLLVLPPIRDGALGGPLAGLPWRRVLAAGALFGIAAGFKLTNLIFAPAFCLALLLVARPVAAVALGAGFALGWLIGLLPSAAWWWWLVWRHFESPTFPLFNGLFRSSWFPAFDLYDERFLPRTALEWLAYPFWWITAGAQPRPAELPFRDARFALLLLALTGLLAALGQRVLRRRRQQPGAVWLQPDHRFLAGFVAVAYLLWLTSSAILRYAIVIEVLGTLLVALLALRLAEAAPAATRRGLRCGFVLLVCGGLIAWTRPMNWGRIPFGDKVFSVDMGWTPPGALLVAITGPVAYVNAFVPPDRGARMLGFSFTTEIAQGLRLHTESARIVAEHPGPIFVLWTEEGHRFFPSLPKIGLAGELGPCRRIGSNLDGGATLACAATRLP